jgi:hypothetical protein
MNWLKTLWNKLVDKTSTAPTLVEVEEVEELEVDTATVANIFTQLCVESGIARKWVVRYDMAAAFIEWYDGPADVESVRDSIKDFKKARPDLAPNLVKIK